jgi:hypothetical protein
VCPTRLFLYSNSTPRRWVSNWKPLPSVSPRNKCRFANHDGSIFCSCRDLPKKVFEFHTVCHSGDRLFLLISRFFPCSIQGFFYPKDMDRPLFFFGPFFLIAILSSILAQQLQKKTKNVRTVTCPLTTYPIIPQQTTNRIWY